MTRALHIHHLAMRMQKQSGAKLFFSYGTPTHSHCCSFICCFIKGKDRAKEGSKKEDHSANETQDSRGSFELVCPSPPQN